MPFTLAHPIAVLPLWQLSKRRLDLPALAVGATIPDISYFLSLRPVVNIGHSLPGLFIEGIPSAVVVLLVGRYFLWQPLQALLPVAIARRFPQRSPYRFWPLSRFGWIVVSAALGALTHIAWDNFTHSYGWGVSQFELLSADVLSVPIYQWLQYGGGLVGFSLLLLISWRAISQLPPRYPLEQLPPKGKQLAWSVVAIATAATIWLAIALHLDRDSRLAAIIVRAIIGSISGLWLGLCLYAAGFWAERFWTFSKLD